MLGGGYNPLATSASALEYQTSIDQSFTINDTLTIILSDDKVSIDNLLPGQSADSSILDVTVLSNNPYGYKLTGTVGSTDYTADALYNTADTTKTFTNIGYGNNKATLSDFDANTWGYSYSLDGGTTWQGSTGNTGYTGLPLYNSSNTMTFLDTDDISASTGDTMKFKIGAKASSTKESGEYNNTINFVATGYSFPLYTITYNANGGTVTPTSEQVRGTSVTLPTPSNGTKIFGGWCDSAITSGTCTGNTYQAGASYTPTGNVTLTAIWRASMQNFACSSLNIGDTTTLEDARDGIEYNVGKLADGKCWMLDNLAFNGKDDQGNGSYITMDSTNTHINTTKTWNDTIRTGWTSSSQNSYVASYINDASKDVVPEGSDTKSKAGNWKIGVYYNYCAVTLDTICSSSTSTVASYDVCPKGWKLPSGGSSGDFQNLYSNYYTTYDTYRDALHLPLSGYFGSGTPYDQGSSGLWWSTTASNGTNRYNLYVLTSGIYSARSSDRRFGFSIRCISQ